MRSCNPLDNWLQGPLTPMIQSGIHTRTIQPAGMPSRSLGDLGGFRSSGILHIPIHSYDSQTFKIHVWYNLDKLDELYFKLKQFCCGWFPKNIHQAMGQLDAGRFWKFEVWPHQSAGARDCCLAWFHAMWYPLKTSKNVESLWVDKAR